MDGQYGDPQEGARPCGPAPSNHESPVTNHGFLSSLTSVNSASTTSSWALAPGAGPAAPASPWPAAAAAAYSDWPASSSALALASIWALSSPLSAVSRSANAARSEERRVGKEWRSRCAQYEWRT